MRVIGGSAKGRPLVAPRGPVTRPTSDRVREALFDMLEAARVDFSAVLDLYAGSGALGIEALSRGDGRCDFVERDPKACEAIRRNLRAVVFDGRARVFCVPVRRALARLPGPYTLVLADPPYADAEALATLADCDTRVAEGGVLAFEHGKRTNAPAALGALRLFRQRRHGDTVVTLYGREAGHPVAEQDLADALGKKGAP